MKFITIICPTYNEEKYIEGCINSLLFSDFPKESMEIFFVDGMSTDKTRVIILDYMLQFSNIQLLDNPKRFAPCAMNLGIQQAKGEIIIRIDAHAYYPPSYFTLLVNYLQKLGADNVGGLWQTDVLNKTSKSLAIKEVLANPFGVGNASFRIGAKKIQEVDTVPFGCFRRDVFTKYGFYDERLIRNQDIELNKRIKRGGGKIFLIPNVYCIYYARETIKAIMKNNYQNGKWNIFTIYLTKSFDSLSIRHFIPLFFILSLILPLLLSIISPYFIILFCLSLFLYLGLFSILSLKIAISKKLNFFYLILTFLSLHLSYGWGSINGILRLPFLKK